MNSFNFDELIVRRGTNCAKWDEAPNDNVIPLWVADMDFKAAPCIIDALRNRVEQGVFGYSVVPEKYYDAVISWFHRRHGFDIKREWMLYTTGVIPALSATIKALTQPGDKVLIQTPVYNHFYSSIRNNGCIAEECPLAYEEGKYSVDFAAFEKQCADEKVKVFVLCNPHNPAGRVWSADEMKKMGEICHKYNVRVVADEIHCELVMPGYKYIPYGSVNDDLLKYAVILSSPSKAFNIAGLQIANIVCYDENVRRAIDRAININEVCDVNPFGIVGVIAAYNDGEEWLQSLLSYIYENYLYLKELFSKELPNFHVVELQGTYLAWVDCSALKLTSRQLSEYLLQHNDVWVNEGEMYGQPKGHSFIRINLACQKARLKEGLSRVVAGIRQLQKA